MRRSVAQCPCCNWFGKHLQTICVNGWDNRRNTDKTSDADARGDPARGVFIAATRAPAKARDAPTLCAPWRPHRREVAIASAQCGRRGGGREGHRGGRPRGAARREAATGAQARGLPMGGPVPAPGGVAAVGGCGPWPGRSSNRFGQQIGARLCAGSGCAEGHRSKASIGGRVKGGASRIARNASRSFNLHYLIRVGSPFAFRESKSGCARSPSLPHVRPGRGGDDRVLLEQARMVIATAPPGRPGNRRSRSTAGSWGSPKFGSSSRTALQSCQKPAQAVHRWFRRCGRSWAIHKVARQALQRFCSHLCWPIIDLQSCFIDRPRPACRWPCGTEVARRAALQARRSPALHPLWSV